MAPSESEGAMKKTRVTEEKMVTILREADTKPVPDVSKKHGVSGQTIYSWRKHFGSLEPSDVKRVRQLDQENGRLKKMVADRGVVARIVTGPHDAHRQDPHLPIRYDTGRPSSVIRLRISQPRTASLPCPAGLRARRPSPMMDL